MPAIAGRKSTFEVSTDGNTFVHVDGLVDISFSYNVSEIECTKHSIGLSDAGRREYLPNLEDRTFDISCRWLDGDPGQDIILDAASTNPKTIFYYRFKMDTVTNIPFIGRAFATSISPTGPLDDTAGVDFTLRCTTLGLPDPALDLQFAETLSLTDQASGNNLITFTRATSATYVGADGLIKTAASGEARFDHDPTTGESLGLLIEEQRTNHTTFSTGLTAFNLNETTLTENATTAPDGTSTASKIVATATNNPHYANYPATGLASGSVVSWSCFVKYAGDRYAVIHAADISPAAFDLLTGEFEYVSPQITAAQAVAFTNGWYRLTITYTSAISLPFVQVYIGGSPVTSFVYTGNGVDGIYVWGAQIEESSFPTSYIPTTTASVTRNLDSVLISGANFTSWYNQNEGSFLAEYQRPFDAKAVGYSNPRIFSVSQGNSTTNRILLFSFTSGADDSEIAYIETSGVETAGIRHPLAIGANESAKTSVSYSATTSKASSSRDGNPSVDDTSAAIFTSMDRIRIGNASTAPSGGSSIHNGTIKSLTYYNERIPNAALQELTVK